MIWRLLIRSSLIVLLSKLICAVMNLPGSSDTPIPSEKGLPKTVSDLILELSKNLALEVPPEIYDTFQQAVALQLRGNIPGARKAYDNLAKLADAKITGGRVNLIESSRVLKYNLDLLDKMEKMGRK